MKKNFLISFILIFISTFSVLSQTSTRKEIDRPKADKGPTKVTVYAAILNINEIDAAAQTITCNVYFAATWKDPRLAHNSKMSIIKPIDEIWNPQIVIVNRQNMILTMPNEAEIQPDGTVIYRQRIFGQFSQNLDFRNFPFDRQNFKIVLAATDYNPEEIEFSLDSVQQTFISKELTVKDWDILSFYDVSKPYSIIPGAKSNASMSFEITAERKSSYYIFSFMIPFFLIIMMSMGVFWLDPKLPSPQISVAVTSMLTLIAYRFTIADSLPKISYLTRMDIFIFCSSVLIFLTFSEAIVTAALAAKSKEALAMRIDLYSRWVFPVIYAIVILIAFVIY